MRDVPRRVGSIDLDHDGLGPMTIAYGSERPAPADRVRGPLDADDLRTARCAALRLYRRFLDREDRNR